MQRRLVLDVDSVNVDLPDVDQELDQLRTLDGIDEAGSTKMIGTVYISPGSHKTLDDVLKRASYAMVDPKVLSRTGLVLGLRPYLNQKCTQK